MSVTLSFHKYFEKELAAFFYILSILGIAGNSLDISTLYLKHPSYELYLNIGAISIMILSGLMYFTKTINLKMGLSLSLYTIYLNMLFSNIDFYDHIFHEQYLLREAIFTGFLTTAAFLFVSQWHGFIVGISFLIYYTYAVIDSKSDFLESNLAIITVIFISYIFSLNLFYKFINRSIVKIQEDAYLIHEQNEELTQMNNELGDTQKQINAQHEELLSLSESLYNQNEELLKKNSQLEDAVLQKVKFFSIIAHDLKAPISSLTSLTEQMLQNYDSMPEEEKKYWLNKNLSSTKLFYELLENLLVWSRSQIGMIELNLENLDLNELVDKIFNLYHNQSSLKSIQMLKNLNGNTSVCADRMMLESILRNLISNGIKYSYKNGAISVNSEISDHSLIISVKDHGVGIPNTRLKNLFSIDKKNSTPGTNGEKGTGLGLQICKDFIERHNGRIWLQSEPEKGTTIFVSLPGAAV